jgi:hypothetical protein
MPPSGERPDRVPIFLRDLTLGLDVCDYTTPAVRSGPNGYDADKSARCVVETQRLLGHDCVVGGIHDLGLDVERLGGRAEFPERGIPLVATPALTVAGDIPSRGDLASVPLGAAARPPRAYSRGHDERACAGSCGLRLRPDAVVLAAS